MQSPKISPQIYGQWLFNKVVKIHNLEKIISSINGVGKTGQSTCQRMILGSNLIPYTKPTYNGLNLSIRTETVELQKVNLGKFCVVSPSNDFF